MDIFLLIIITHWVADFIFQDEKWALGKSKSWEPLLCHTIMYSLLWIPPVYVFTGNLIYTFIFVIITFIAHTTTDYFTSRVVSKLFAKGHLGSSIPNLGAFSAIGFDQVLHYTQLILTWYWLFGLK